MVPHQLLGGLLPEVLARHLFITRFQYMQLWRRGGAGCNHLEPKALEMLVHCLGAEVFGQKVGRVLRTGNLPDHQVSLLDLVLKPQILNSDVAKFSYARAVDNANCRTGVTVHDAIQSFPKVGCEGYNA